MRRELERGPDLAVKRHVLVERAQLQERELAVQVPDARVDGRPGTAPAPLGEELRARPEVQRLRVLDLEKGGLRGGLSGGLGVIVMVCWGTKRRVRGARSTPGSAATSGPRTAGGKERVKGRVSGDG